MMLPLFLACVVIQRAHALRIAPKSYTHYNTRSKLKLGVTESFDPFEFQSTATTGQITTHSKPESSKTITSVRDSVFLLGLPLLFALVMQSPSSIAIASESEQNIFDPSQFQPVCPASDTFYQVLKITANGAVGVENADEYGPLIASVLLRIRLELCVLESFLYEAVIPFISKKGLSWVLPLHETTESFLAGTIFAIASNFILLGSTKILSVLFIYADVITGMPTRFIGDTLKKTTSSSSPPQSIGTVLKLYGDVIGAFKSFLETADTFVGRYLVVFTTVYITFKFAHYKFFNDIFP